MTSWYNAKPAPKQMALMRDDMAQMMMETKSGIPIAGMSMPIDQSFLEGMIVHRAHAVMMGKDALLRKTTRAESK